MARQRRHTEPLETLHGTLTDYEVIDRHLIEGELRGRAWVFAKAKASSQRETFTDWDVRDLHRAMFGELLSWAGHFRKVDVGPAGQLWFTWAEVPMAVRNFTDDLHAWVAALPTDPSLEQIAGVVADAHHRFQRVHPFQDTNGRTGRVLDLWLLWGTFSLLGASVAASPLIEPFPDESEVDDYYAGLQEADGERPERLRAYYTRRILAAFQTNDE